MEGGEIQRDIFQGNSLRSLIFCYTNDIAKLSSKKIQKML